jgi:hypothetical protein
VLRVLTNQISAEKNTRFNNMFQIKITHENDDRDNIFGMSTYFPGSRDSSVGVAAGYGLEDWGFVPGRCKMFYSASSRPAVRPTQPLIQWVPRSPFVGVKLTGRKAGNSIPSTAEAKNGGAIPPLPHMPLRRGA